MTIEETIKALRKGKKICLAGVGPLGTYCILDKDEKIIYEIQKSTNEVISSPYALAFDGEDICDGTDYEIYKPGPLDAEEKAYLRNIIRPFRKDVFSITKLRVTTELIRIRIRSKNDKDMFSHVLSKEWFSGMGEGKEYTLEELELN